MGGIEWSLDTQSHSPRICASSNLATSGTKNARYHCLNHCWHVGNWTFERPFQWNWFKIRQMSYKKRIWKCRLQSDHCYQITYERKAYILSLLNVYFVKSGRLCARNRDTRRDESVETGEESVEVLDETRKSCNYWIQPQTWPPSYSNPDVNDLSSRSFRILHLGGCLTSWLLFVAVTP